MKDNFPTSESNVPTRLNIPKGIYFRTDLENPNYIECVTGRAARVIYYKYIYMNSNKPRFIASNVSPTYALGTIVYPISKFEAWVLGLDDL